MEDPDKTTHPSPSPPPRDSAVAPLPKSRKAEIPPELKEICERYGEDVIGLTLASGHTPRAKELQTIYATDETVEHARTWLTERGRSLRRRERITFSLEIAIVLLILGEILLGLWQGHLQSRNFDEQQRVLTNLQTSSAATAKTLTSLQSTTELMNTTQQMQLDALKKSEAQAERSAKAGEASASTASQALHVSERAYVHMTTSLAKPPAAGEKLQFTILVGNLGHTPALDLTNRFFFSPVPTSTPIKAARDIAAASYPQGQQESVYTLASGQTTTMHADSQAPLPQPLVDQIADGKRLLYVFATATYKDVFNQSHHTETCNTYQPQSNTFALCPEYDKFD